MPSPTHTTTFMGLVLPVVGVQTGPEWAQEDDDAFGVIDEHDHSEGKGTYVTPAGLNISQDLSFADRDTAASSRATDLKSVVFESLDAALTALTDYRSLFVVGAELYYTDGNGTAVQITSDGAVLVTAGNISGMTGGAAVAYSDVTKTYVFTQSANKSANLDAGSVTVRDTSETDGEGVTIAAKTGLSASYDLELPDALPGETEMLTLSSAGKIAADQNPTIGSRPTFTGLNTGDTSDTTAGNLRYHSSKIQGRDGSNWRELANVVVGEKSASSTANTAVTSTLALGSAPVYSDSDKIIDGGGPLYSIEDGANALDVEATIAAIQSSVSGTDYISLVLWYTADGGSTYHAIARAMIQSSAANGGGSAHLRARIAGGTFASSTGLSFYVTAYGTASGTRTLNKIGGTNVSGAVSSLRVREVRGG